MAKKYLDYDGLLYFWQKLKAYFVKQESGKGLSTNDYTTTEKNKLAGIASGAEVNQNAFSNVKVGTTTIAADSKTDTVELVAGSNVTLTPDATNDKVTIAATNTTYTNPKLGQGYGTCATASGTNAKVVTLANYELVTGGVVFVKFDNTVEPASGSNVSMNINGKGAKEIRYKGSPLATKTIFAGDTVAFMYDGTYYQMLLADGRVNLAFHSDWTTGTNDNGTYHQKYLERRSNDGSEATNMSYFTIYDATTDQWGFMSAADKKKLNGIAFGTCATAAGTTAKVVDSDGFTLQTGSLIAVKFTVTNSGAVGSLTMNVEGTGDKAIKYRGGNIPSAGTLAANRVYLFAYDGTDWELVGDFDTNTTYTNMSLGQGYGTCATAADTLAKVVTLSSYNLTVGGIVFVKFEHGLTIADGDTSEVTLNINGKGAKPIRYWGDKPKTNAILSGDIVAFMYDGTYYQMLIADNRVHIGFDPWEDGTYSDGDVYHRKMLVRRNYDASEQSQLSYVDLAEATQSRWGVMSTADKTKLDGIAAGAQVNSITGVKGSAESAYRTGQVSITAANVGAIATTARGAANGVAPLNASSKIDSTYLPSFVDDVVEAYARSGQTALSSTWLATGSATGTVITPETGKIYILMADSGDYAANTQFRWSGTTYVKLNDGGVSSITNSEIDTIVAT